MSDLLQSGQHPDADQLNAFVEHALPDHEQQETLAHLAVCPDCRAIVALSIPTVEVSTPEPFRKSWFSGWNLAWPLVAAIAGLVLFFVHIHNVAIGRKGTDAPQVAISNPPPAPLQAPVNPQVQALPNPQASNTKPLVVSEKSPAASRRDEPTAAGDVSAKNLNPAIDAKSLDTFTVHGNAAGLAQGGPALQGSHGQSNPQAANASGIGVANTKTPPLENHFEQPLVGSNAASTTTSNRPDDAQAFFGIHQQAPSPQAVPAPVVPAPPEAAPAKVDGGVSTTVEVAAAPTADLSTMSAEVANPSIGNTISQHPLPSKLPILSMVSNAHRVLAIDTNNTVFFSNDYGTTWNAIPVQWRGRAVKVSLASSASARAFASLGRMASPAATNSPAVSTQPSRESTSSAALTGTVTDQSGAVIPDASVVIGNATAPNLRTVKTDRAGHYLIDDLVPGSYRVEINALGFNKQQLDLTVAASQRNLANFTLVVGSATQTVALEAAPAEPGFTTSVEKKKNAPASLASQPQAVFEMTTDTGEHWTTTDGHIWKHR